MQSCLLAPGRYLHLIARACGAYDRQQHHQRAPIGSDGFNFAPIEFSTMRAYFTRKIDEIYLRTHVVHPREIISKSKGLLLL